jgi:hypothetical protein
MNSLYKQLLAAKGAPQAASAPNSSQLRNAPMNLRSAMQKYAMGGDVSESSTGISPQQAAILASLKNPPTGAMGMGRTSPTGLLASLGAMGTKGPLNNPQPFVPEDVYPMSPPPTKPSYPVLDEGYGDRPYETDPYGEPVPDWMPLSPYDEPVAPDLIEPLRRREIPNPTQTVYGEPQLDENYGYPRVTVGDTGEVEQFPPFSTEPDYPGPIESPKSKYGDKAGVASVLAKLIKGQSGAGVLQNQDTLMRLLQTLKGPR